ncbi:glucose-1-phosphate adenylyltransferase [Vibrio sp. JCM 19236]|nr:glucose-1-phosphate adenylyltransferase [Vibrio sp. JCM 19236]
MTEHNNNYSHLPSNNLVRSTVALVLAGGKGTRLKGLTKEIAKPAVSFGGKYKIIDFTLSNCVNSGIRRVGVLTQFMAHDLIDHLQKGWNFMTNSALNEGVSIIQLSSVQVKLGIVVLRMRYTRTLISSVSKKLSRCLS